jgi:hypothetical protein
MAKYPYLLKKDKPDARDFIFKTPSVTSIPPMVNWQHDLWGSYDQGQLGSCTANAWVRLVVWEMRKAGLVSDDDRSRLDLYWQERYLEGTVNEDSGAYIRDGGKVLANRGVAKAVDWPYDISKFTIKPPAAADLSAGEAKITEYHRITNLSDLKVAIASKLLVVAGITIYESFESFEVSATGIVPMPDKQKEQVLGGHAIIICGYDDSRNVVICQNSWGTNWGDHGFFTLPYAFIQDSDLTSDLWTATIKVAPTPSPTPSPDDPASVDLATALNALKDMGVIDSPEDWVKAINHIEAHPYAKAPLSTLNYLDLLVKKFYLGIKK